jgi:hypothetical protein
VAALRAARSCETETPEELRRMRWKDARASCLDGRKSSSGDAPGGVSRITQTGGFITSPRKRLGPATKRRTVRWSNVSSRGDKVEHVD